VHMGSLIERAPTGELYNTAVVLGPDGGLRASYRKIHRFGFSDGEPRLLAAGDAPVVYDAGEHGRWGLATCYDLRFPELFRALVDRGAEAVVVVAGWPAARIGHWSLLARARAVEDQVFVLGCNAVGQQGRTALGGRSVVIDPWGGVVAEAGGDAEVTAVDVDLADVARVRAEFPVLADRRM
ncbi:MAG: carbon-nitrogen family hydrolase, partial [Actinomycetota bacterium]|nr:carbon-nitrogen family hydrolase [Actinomycetota bacterium]